MTDPTHSPAPPRLAVFLRGINLGRRRVKKDELAAPFRSAGFTGIQTYLASGNIVIDAPEADGSEEPRPPSDPRDLEARVEGATHREPEARVEGTSHREVEARVEEAIHRGLGFEADAFVRPLGALATLARHELLVDAEADGLTPHVILLKAAPTPAVEAALRELEGADDRFPVLGRHVLWLRRGRLSDSEVQPRHLEKALGGVPNTMRKVTTLRRMVRKFGRE